MRILVITFLLIGAIYCQKGEKGPKGEKGSKPEKGTWTPPPDWTPPSKGSKGTKGTTTGGQGSTTEESTTSAIIVNSTQKLRIFLRFIKYVPLFQPDEKPTEPTACTDANQGRCECADTSEGFQTYTFWLGDVQRCFTVFHPRQGEAIPVMLAPNCYAQDKLQGLEGNTWNFTVWN